MQEQRDANSHGRTGFRALTPVQIIWSGFVCRRQTTWSVVHLAFSSPSRTCYTLHLHYLRLTLLKYAAETTESGATLRVYLKVPHSGYYRNKEVVRADSPRQ